MKVRFILNNRVQLIWGRAPNEITNNAFYASISAIFFGVAHMFGVEAFPWSMGMRYTTRCLPDYNPISYVAHIAWRWKWGKRLVRDKYQVGNSVYYLAGPVTIGVVHMTDQGAET